MATRRSRDADRAAQFQAAPAAGEEADWAAEKREFVADTRDQVADRRDAVADARDALAEARETLADAREARLGRWERRLAERAAALGLSFEPPPAGSADQGARHEAATARTDAGHERERVAAEREEAAEQRRSEGRATLLAAAFAGIAQHLYESASYDEVLSRIAEAAVATVAGAEMASVTVDDKNGYRTGASTAEAAAAVDQAQYEASEGPSLDALTTAKVDVPSYPDPRWPGLADQPSRHGVESSLSYHLNTPGPDAGESSTASLSMYAGTPDAFGVDAQEIGFILAAHASLAARAVGERVSLEGIDNRLQDTLLSRDVIGQAKGILMERLRVTPDEAFDILRRASQRLNVKLREVARRLTETGEVSPDDLDGPPPAPV